MLTPTESTLPVAVDDQAHTASAHPLPLERVEAELCTLAGQIAAATSRFLCLLAEFDARDGWAGWGVRSCAHWLAWRCGLDLRTGREYVRVARALNDLPHTMLTFGQGRLSYSKVRAISRVATPDNEESLVDAAMHSPTGQLERLVRGLQTAQRNGDEDDKASASRASRSGRDRESRHGVQWRWDDDGIWSSGAASTPRTAHASWLPPRVPRTNGTAPRPRMTLAEAVQLNRPRTPMLWPDVRRPTWHRRWSPPLSGSVRRWTHRCTPLVRNSWCMSRRRRWWKAREPLEPVRRLPRMTALWRPA